MATPFHTPMDKKIQSLKGNIQGKALLYGQLVTSGKDNKRVFQGIDKSNHSVPYRPNGQSRDGLLSASLLTIE
jgi:hypothetical protein